MAVITLWHNPRCSKSRQTLALIEEAGAPVTLRKYLEDAPTLAELELGLTRGDDAGTLLAAAAANPILIERPIAFKDGRAIIGRPPEAVKELL